MSSLFMVLPALCVYVVRVAVPWGFLEPAGPLA
jgi:hypothetical protein